MLVHVFEKKELYVGQNIVLKRRGGRREINKPFSALVSRNRIILLLSPSIPTPNTAREI